MREVGVHGMEKKRDGRKDVVMTDLEALVPENHLLRK